MSSRFRSSAVCWELFDFDIGEEESQRGRAGRDSLIGLVLKILLRFNPGNKCALTAEASLFGAEFAEDGYGGGCADAVGAGFEECADVGECADAS